MRTRSPSSSLLIPPLRLSPPRPLPRFSTLSPLARFRTTAIPRNGPRLTLCCVGCEQRAREEGERGRTRLERAQGRPGVARPPLSLAGALLLLLRCSKSFCASLREPGRQKNELFDRELNPGLCRVDPDEGLTRQYTSHYTIEDFAMSAGVAVRTGSAQAKRPQNGLRRRRRPPRLAPALRLALSYRAHGGY